MPNTLNNSRQAIKKNRLEKSSIPALDLFSYSMGGFGSNLMFHLIGTYLMFFLTDYYGLSPLVVGQIFLVARIVDALSDPLFGVISDNTYSRFGRYRPYLIFGAPVIGITIAFLFSGPQLSPMGEILFAYGSYIAYSLASTIVNIPYHSLTPLMTNKYHERTLVVATKQGVGSLATLMAVIAPPLILDMFNDGLQGYRITGVLFGGITTIMFWICAYGARHYDSADTVKKAKRSMSFKDITFVIRNNTPLIALMVAHATNVFGFAIESSIAIYFFKYYLNKEALFPLLSGIGSIIPLFLMIALPFLGRHFSKKALYLISSWTGMLTCIAGYLFVNWIPVELMFILLVLSTVCNIFSGNLSWLLMPDCVEYGEYKTGINANGFTASMMMYVAKCSSAIAGLTVGILLSTADYIPNQPQTDNVLQVILALKFLTVIFSHLFSIIAMKFYSITPETYNRFISELEAKKATSGTASIA